MIPDKPINDIATDRVVQERVIALHGSQFVTHAGLPVLSFHLFLGRPHPLKAGSSSLAQDERDDLRTPEDEDEDSGSRGRRRVAHAKRSPVYRIRARLEADR